MRGEIPHAQTNALEFYHQSGRGIEQLWLPNLAEPIHGCGKRPPRNIFINQDTSVHTSTETDLLKSQWTRNHARLCC